MRKKQKGVLPIQWCVCLLYRSGAIVAVKRLNDADFQTGYNEEKLRIFAEFRQEAFTWRYVHMTNALTHICVLIVSRNWRVHACKRFSHMKGISD